MSPSLADISTSDLNDFGASQQVAQTTPLLAGNEHHIQDTQAQGEVAEKRLHVRTGLFCFNVHSTDFDQALAHTLPARSTVAQQCVNQPPRESPGVRKPQHFGHLIKRERKRHGHQAVDELGREALAYVCQRLVHFSCEGKLKERTRFVGSDLKAERTSLRAICSSSFKVKAGAF